MVTHYYLVSILNLYLKGVIIHILFSMFLREMLIARNNVQYIMVAMYPLLLQLFFAPFRSIICLHAELFNKIILCEYAVIL